MSRPARGATADAPAPRVRRFDESARKGDRRREQLLDAAEALLRAQPSSELTLDRVAQAAGVSRSSLYFYFDSKWAIIDQLIERASAEMFERDVVALSEQPDLRTYLRVVVESASEGWRTHRAVFLAATERSAHADESTDHWRTIMGRFADTIAERFDAEPGGLPQLAALGGSRAAAEIACWMVERNLFMHFSRRRRKAETAALLDALTAAMLRLVGLPESG